MYIMNKFRQSPPLVGTDEDSVAITGELISGQKAADWVKESVRRATTHSIAFVVRTESTIEEIRTRSKPRNA